MGWSNAVQKPSKQKKNNTEMVLQCETKGFTSSSSPHFDTEEFRFS